MSKYKNHYNPRVRFQQHFDRKKIFIEQAGKKYNLYDRIQENAEDTDIYKTLEKYGTIEPMKKIDLPAVQTEFDEYMSLMDLHEKKIKADNMWKNLPAGIREEFKNDKYNFLEKGEEWLKKQMQPQVKQPQTQQTQAQQTQGEDK